uniref:WAP domain-containing protein n=1 Tax=Amphilophus citrinellus TaxID=61819 RepID=A0A3Q0SRW7_AMPCI
MDRHWSTVCALIVSFSLCNNFSFLSAKPGVCPDRSAVIGLCVELCFNDNDCPNNEKCCSNGCGNECVAPVIVKRELGLLKILSQSNVRFTTHSGSSCLSIMIYFFLSEKPGVCPFRPWNFIRCDELCSNDSDCPNNQKCCSTGCGQECMAPNIGET